MTQQQRQTILTGSSSQSSSPCDVLHPEIGFDAINVNFEHSTYVWTGLIARFASTNSSNNQHLCKLELTPLRPPGRIYAFLYNEWADFLYYLWNSFTIKDRELMQISITFRGISVKKLTIKQKKNIIIGRDIGFIVDDNIPYSPNIYIELKTSINRSCGKNGIILTKQHVLNHANKTAIIPIKNNTNLNFLKPIYKYTPLNELKAFRQVFAYGWITFITDPKATRGGSFNNWCQQIRIRDASLDFETNDIQIMIFGNFLDKFPQPRLGDLIRMHRFEVDEYKVGEPQGILKLDKVFVSWVLMDGNLTLPNTSETIRQKSSDGCTFDVNVDGYFVKYLKIACRIHGEALNPPNKNNDNDNNNNRPAADVLQLKTNQNQLMYLSEIKSCNLRINLTAMIVGRILDSDDNDQDTFTFYWIIWDGSNCENNCDLFDFYEDDNDNNDNDIDEMISISHNIGTRVLLLVSQSSYEDSWQYYNEICLGKWCELTNILYDNNLKELIFDSKSSINSGKIDITTNKFIQQRMELIYYEIYLKSSIITQVSSSSSSNYHNIYQSYTPIFNIISLKKINCKYRIRGRTCDYRPQNIQHFTKYNAKIKKWILLFELTIIDSSDTKISVLFRGENAKIFLNINNDLKDLTKIQNKNQLEFIGKSMELIMNKWSIMDICIRSYKVLKHDICAYKICDTVLINT